MNVVDFIFLLSPARDGKVRGRRRRRLIFLPSSPVLETRTFDFLLSHTHQKTGGSAYKMGEGEKRAVLKEKEVEKPDLTDPPPPKDSMTRNPTN